MWPVASCQFDFDQVLLVVIDERDDMVDLKNAVDDREACMSFLRTELHWADFREEFFKDDISGQNAKKLLAFLRRFEEPKAGGE